MPVLLPMRILALLLLTFTVAIIAPSPASASCYGPRIVVSDGEVDRGTKLRIVGEGWGDDCHDTGIPSDAHGALGNPLDSIEVAFVQDGKETVVARGSADDYGFDALVTVPSTLRPGIARLVARSGEYGDYERPTVIVSKAKPVAAAGPVVLNLDEDRDDLSGTESIHDEPIQAEGSNTRAWLAGGAAVLALAAGAVLILRRARRS